MRLVNGLIVLLALAPIHRGASADEFTDHVERALSLYKKGNFIAARSELNHAVRILEPRAKAQIPPPTVKGSTYINYEHSFKVSGIGKDWRTRALVSKTSTDATTPLATIAYAGNADGEIVILFVRNLRVYFGPQRYKAIVGSEPKILRAFGDKTSTFVRNLTDCSKPTHTEYKVAGKPALSSEFTAKRDGAAMRCFVLQVLVGEKVFTGIFISTEANWPERSKDFGNIIGTISFDVPIPEPVLLPPEVPADKADPPADKAGKTQ